jgi:hypothetical protein
MGGQVVLPHSLLDKDRKSSLMLVGLASFKKHKYIYISLMLGGLVVLPHSRNTNRDSSLILVGHAFFSSYFVIALMAIQPIF